MVVGEVLAGMALVRSGVDFIKGNITAAQDIGKFVSAIDNILDGEDQIQKRRSGKAGVGGLKDQLGIKSTAHEVIDAKLAAEQAAQTAAGLLSSQPRPSWRHRLSRARAPRPSENCSGAGCP